MSFNFTISPSSFSRSESEDVNFKSHIPSGNYPARIHVENLTTESECYVYNSQSSYVYISEGSSDIEGNINLLLPDDFDSSVVSISATLQYKIDEEWVDSHVSSCNCILTSDSNRGEDTLRVEPAFVGFDDSAQIIYKGSKNDKIQVEINGKRFLLRSNELGEATMRVRGSDLISGSSFNSSAVQKFSIQYSKDKENFAKQYISKDEVHFVPASMQVLQATNNPETPECAIIDSDPPEGAELEAVGDFCYESSISDPDWTVFPDTDTTSSLCDTVKDAFDFTAGADILGNCSIFNSLDSANLPSGSSVAVYSSPRQKGPNIDNQSASELLNNVTKPQSSKVFMTYVPSSLKFKANPIRIGSILEPEGFYHTFTINNAGSQGFVGIVFWLEQGEFIELRHDLSSGNAIEDLVEQINANPELQNFGILAFSVGESSLVVTSNNEFSIRSNTSDGVNVSIDLNTNKNLEILVHDKNVLQDVGTHIVFLKSELDEIAYEIVDIQPVFKDNSAVIIRINVPQGVNNGVGPTLTEDILCQEFVIVDQSVDIQSSDNSEIFNAPHIPYIRDQFNREISSVNPAVTASKNFFEIEEGSRNFYIYIVCQAVVNGVYQLFLYSLEVRENLSSRELTYNDSNWIQLTNVGENKNPKISCDSANNIHIIWESDRGGNPSQIYYSCLGPSSVHLNNRTLVSSIEKHLDSPLLTISDPISMQDDWDRMVDGGGVSIESVSRLGVEGSPKNHGALALYKLNKDNLGNDFNGLFDQLSYQISFDLDLDTLSGESLTGYTAKDIDEAFLDFKSQFTPLRNNRYQRDKNIFTLDKFDAFYSKIIPIAGSYKIGDISSNLVAGGQDARHVNHNFDNEQINDQINAIVSNFGVNVNHFMIALMPEKIRFKAQNVDPLFRFLENNDLDPNVSSDTDQYIPKIEEVLYTGRFKFAIVIATTEDQSTGDAANQKFHLIRQFGEPIVFDEQKNIKIALHYYKSNQDYLDSQKDINPFFDDQKSRFHGNIVVCVDDKPALAENFVANFSDQYRSFDLGLGFPSGSSFSTQETLPFNGNEYDDLFCLMTFDNVAIGPHSIQLNEDIIGQSLFDRSTDQMISQSPVNNLVNLGDFESESLLLTTNVAIGDGEILLDPWSVSNRVDLLTDDFSRRFSFTGNRCLSLTGTDNANLGAIEQSINTDAGQDYTLVFALSSHPDASLNLATDVTRSVRLSITGSAPQEFSTTIRSDETSTNYVLYRVSFTATSASTVIRFANITSTQAPFNSFGPLIDYINVFKNEDLADEFLSYRAHEIMRVDQSDYLKTFGISSPEQFSQIPVTYSDQFQNINADLYVDDMNKPHIAWQSNRDSFWNIFYSGARNISTPFRFDTQITDTTSSSLMPSISVDPLGRRFITWHDNRNGRYYQIYAAKNFNIDPLYIDPCNTDNIENYKFSQKVAQYSEYGQYNEYDGYNEYGYNENWDEYVENTLSCNINLNFKPDTSSSYHFAIDFYADQERINRVKTIDSRSSVIGWKVDGSQMFAEGAALSAGQSYEISYTPSSTDDIFNSVYYASVRYESAEFSEGSIVSFNNADIQDLESGYNLREGANENSTPLVFFESIAETSFFQSSQTPDTLLSRISDQFSDANPTIIIGGNGVLDGFDSDEIVSSYYVRFDPSAGDSLSQSFSLTFDTEIVALYVNNNDLKNLEETFKRVDVVYPSPNDGGFGRSSLDVISISADKKTIQINATATDENVASLRIITKPLSSINLTDQFVFHCPFEQSSRCIVDTDYFNNSSKDENGIHFRVSFFADSEMKSVIYSSFTLFDLDGWVFGGSGFPSSGIDVPPGDSVNISFDPEVLPFEKFEDQGGDNFGRSIISGFTLSNLNWKKIEANTISNASFDSDAGRGAISRSGISPALNNSLDDLPCFVSPTKYAGDLTQFYGGRILVSQRIAMQSSPPASSVGFTVYIVSSKGILSFTTIDVPAISDDYTDFSVPIKNTSWTFAPGAKASDSGVTFNPVSTEDMLDALSSVEEIRVTNSYYGGAGNEHTTYMSSFEMLPPSNIDSPVFKKPLICGAGYYYKIERYFQGAFSTIQNGMFICPCFETDANLWREDLDSPEWLCSGQGFDDFRITQTLNECLNSNVAHAGNGLFYITWEDFRYARLTEDRPAVFPQPYYAFYETENDKIYSSAQGSYDRRIVDADQMFFNHNSLIDPFRNLKTIFHDGSQVKHQSCTMACDLETVSPDQRSTTNSCVFSDSTDDEFYFVSTGPSRDIDQYQKIRIKENYVAYSTYLDVETPIPVINDCFIELDIIGVPGTYAYRLKNENDNSFTEWIRIGPEINVDYENDDKGEDYNSAFGAYFISKDRFIAPWIASSGNGTKNICCEVLTYFGKTTRFCVDFQAIYKKLNYTIDFFYDSDLSQPVSSFNGYPVLGLNKFSKPVLEDDLSSLSEDAETSNPRTIFVKIRFNDPDRAALFDKLTALSALGFSDKLTMSVYQQGLNEQVNLPLTKQSSGVFTGSFEVFPDDNVLNKDGLGTIILNIPGQCNPVDIESQRYKMIKIQNNDNIEQTFTVFNDLTQFVDSYNERDTRNSFANPNYYKSKKSNLFNRGDEGVGEAGGNSKWLGGGDGPIE